MAIHVPPTDSSVRCCLPLDIVVQFTTAVPLKGHYANPDLVDLIKSVALLL